jgi:hypothetical protein
VFPQFERIRACTKNFLSLFFAVAKTDGFVDKRRLRKASYARRVKFLIFRRTKVRRNDRNFVPQGISCGAYNEPDEEFLRFHQGLLVRDVE